MSKRSLLDEYKFPGFRPSKNIQGIFGDAYALVIELIRRQKKRCAVLAGKAIQVSTTEKFVGFVTYPAQPRGFIWR